MTVVGILDAMTMLSKTPKPKIGPKFPKADTVSKNITTATGKRIGPERCTSKRAAGNVKSNY